MVASIIVNVFTQDKKYLLFGGDVYDATKWLTDMIGKPAGPEILWAINDGIEEFEIQTIQCRTQLSIVIRY